VFLSCDWVISFVAINDIKTYSKTRFFKNIYKTAEIKADIPQASI